MYKVKEKEFETLDLALKYATMLNEFVTIKGPEFEIVGKFGVDEVNDPDYDGWISRKKK